MRPTLFAFAILAIGSPIQAQDAGGKDPVRALDLTSDGRQFDQWFQRFGYHSGQTVVPERNGVRFQVPALKEEMMVGYCSAFSLAGDFEIQADLEIVLLPAPTAGYGPAFGLTVDADGPDGTVGLTRGLSAEGKPQFVVTRVTVTKPEADIYPASSSRSKLVLKREKAEMICLAADGSGELRELKRVPFTDQRLRYLRLHASNGGSPTRLTGRFTGVRIQAEAIVGGITRSELEATRSYWWWWIPVAVVTFATAWILRRQRRKQEQDEENAAKEATARVREKM